jgi:hypothetical protein
LHVRDVRLTPTANLDLIDGPGLQDRAGDNVIACYAHPLFWAPFIIGGDSGLDSN